MADRTETVTLVADETKREIKIGLLSYDKKNEILKESLTFSVKGQDIDIQEIDYFGLKNKILKATLRGVKANEITDEDGERIYEKYFGKILESIGGGQGN